MFSILEDSFLPPVQVSILPGVCPELLKRLRRQDIPYERELGIDTILIAWFKLFSLMAK